MTDDHLVIYEGYLKKKGDKRWFVLHDDCLMVYKSEKKLHKELAGVIPLETVATVSDIVEDKKGASFSLAIRAGPQFHTFPLQGELQHVQDWVKALKEILFAMSGKCELKLEGKFWKDTDLMIKLRSKFSRAKISGALLQHLPSSDPHHPLPHNTVETVSDPASPAPAAAAAAAAAAARARVATTSAEEREQMVNAARERAATTKKTDELQHAIAHTVLKKHTDWLRVQDEASGSVYFVNVKTKESVWTQPTEWSEEAEKDLRKQLEHPAKPAEPTGELQARLARVGSQQALHADGVRKVTKVEAPVNSNVKKSEPVAAVMPVVKKTDWIRREHTNGVFYWANPFTQASSWEQPADWSLEAEEELLVRLGVKQPPTATASAGTTAAQATTSQTTTSPTTSQAEAKRALHTSGPTLGDRIWLQTNKGFQCGVLRFLGKTSFREGDWVGAELDEPMGLNDGSVNGVRYFTCKAKFGMFCRPENVLPFSYKNGDCVWLQTNSGYATGTLRYVGKTSFSEGDWLGVELSEPKGRNDGTVQGVQYFSCPPNHGLFCRPANLLGFDTESSQYAEVRKNTPWLRRKEGGQFYWVDPITKQSSWTAPAEWVDLAELFKKDQAQPEATKKVVLAQSAAEVGVTQELKKLDQVFGAAAMEEKKWQYVAPRSKDRVGPITPKDLLELIKDEKITRSYYFFATGMKEWTPGIGVAELTPYFKAVEEKKKKAAELKALEEKRLKEEEELNVRLEAERKAAEEERLRKLEEERRRLEEEAEAARKVQEDEARAKAEAEKLAKMNLVEKLEYLPRAYVDQVYDTFKNKRVECKKLLKEESQGKVDYLIRVLVKLVETANPLEEKPYVPALLCLWEVANYPMLEFEVRDAVANVVARESALMGKEIRPAEAKQPLFVVRMQLLHLVLTSVKREFVKALQPAQVMRELLGCFKWNNISLEVPPRVVAVVVHLGFKTFLELKDPNERDFVTAFLEFYQEPDMVAYFAFVRENFENCQRPGERSFLGLKDTRPLKAGIVKVVQKELSKHKKFKSKALLASKSGGNSGHGANHEVNKALLTDDWILPVLSAALEAVRALLAAQIADPVHLSGDAEEEQAQEKLILAVREIRSEAEHARLGELSHSCEQILRLGEEVKVLLFRKWTNKQGLSVVMKFLHLTPSGEVFFQQPNRKAAHLAMDVLSAADQQLLQEHEKLCPREKKEESEVREFRSLSGTKRSLVFIRVCGGGGGGGGEGGEQSVLFQRSDKKFLCFPLAELSERDQDWVKAAPGKQKQDVQPDPSGLFDSLEATLAHLDKALAFLPPSEAAACVGSKRLEQADRKLLSLLAAMEEGAEGLGLEWEWKTILSAQKHLLVDLLFTLFAESAENKLAEGSGSGATRAASILLCCASALSILPWTMGTLFSSPQPEFANGVAHHLALVVSTPGLNWPDRKILPNLKLLHSILAYCGRRESLDLPPIDKLVPNLFAVLAEYQANKLVFDPFVEVVVLANASRPAYSDLSLTLLNTHREFPEYEVRDAVSARVVQIVNQELENRPEHFLFAMLYFVAQAFYPPETKEDREARRKAKLNALKAGTVASAEMPLRAKEFSELFYSNDIFVLQDILCRMLIDTSKDDLNLVHLFQRTLAAMVAWIEYPKHKHKPELVVEALTNIAESYGDPFTVAQLEAAPASSAVPLPMIAMAHTPEALAAVLSKATAAGVHETAIRMLLSFKVLVGMVDEF